MDFLTEFGNQSRHWHHDSGTSVFGDLIVIKYQVDGSDAWYLMGLPVVIAQDWLSNPPPEVRRALPQFGFLIDGWGGSI